MDELIEGIGVVLAGVAIVLAILAATAVLLSVGALYGAGVAIFNYFRAFAKNVKPESPSTSAPLASGEPAIKSYFFGKGYKDLQATIRDCWTANQRFSQNIWAEATKASLAIMRALYYGAAASCMIYGTLFFLLISFFHIVFLAILCAVIFTLFTAVFVLERTYLAFKGFFTVCPHCHVQTRLPVYLCDRCGIEHRRLLPSSHGILFHRCICGQRLPATFFANRGRLPAKCSSCRHFLSRAHTEIRKLYVPVIGGPSSGKSAYLVWLVDYLLQQASAAGETVEFLEPAAATECEFRLQEMRQGRMPAKTTTTTPTAMNLIFTRGGRQHRNLYLYDPAGEAYAGETELIPHHFLSYCSGILFLIDPFSIPAMQARYRMDRLRVDAIRPSKERPDDILDRLLFVLEKHFGLDATSAVETPLAVVLTKVDAFNLESVVGDAALSNFDSKQTTRIAARSELISQRLREWGMTALMEVIESRFNKRAFFTCSSVGFEHRAGTGFSPQRIALPFLWLMQEAKTDIIKGQREDRETLQFDRQAESDNRSNKYYVLLNRAVSKLVDNSYPERGALYDRARQSLRTQLETLRPPLAEDEIEKELAVLEEAIRLIEMATESQAQ